MAYQVIEEDSMSPLVHCTSYCTAGTSGISEFIGSVCPPWMVAFSSDNSSMTWAVDTSTWEDQGKVVMAKLEDPRFTELICSQSRKFVGELQDYAFFLKKEDFSGYSNAQLYEAFEKLFQLSLKANVPGHLINLADYESNYLSDKITGLLAEKQAQVNLADAFSTLVMFNEPSFLQKQDESFYKLLQEVQESKELTNLFTQNNVQTILFEINGYPSFTASFNQHVDSFDWLQFHFDGPVVLDERYFIETLQSELKNGVKGSAKLAELVENAEKLKAKQRNLALKLSLTSKDLYWINVAKNFMFWKATRKDTVFLYGRCSQALFEEIGKRLNGLSAIQVKTLTREELKAALEVGFFDVEEMKKRSEFCVLVVDNGVATIHSGVEAKALWKQVNPRPGAEGIVTELKGTPACPGFVRGVVKLVSHSKDIPKMNPGDILVSPATNPNLVPAMKKAGAIVTDAGGITCHAAIVSRELGIPCVVGTKIATKVLKDGDVVEVDATNGTVKKIG